jgi:hypothetical protein
MHRRQIRISRRRGAGRGHLRRRGCGGGGAAAAAGPGPRARPPGTGGCRCTAAPSAPSRRARAACRAPSRTRPGTPRAPPAADTGGESGPSDRRMERRSTEEKGAKGTCCSARSSVMKVPERPTPALQCTTTGRASGGQRSRNARTNLHTTRQLSYSSRSGMHTGT